MSNKQLIVVVLVTIVILAGGIFGLKTFAGNKPDETDILPTPTQALSEVEGVEAILTPNSKKTQVTIHLSGLGGRFSQLEYELTYQTDDHGTQGGFSNDPVELTADDIFERDIELGSCSTGGKCTYDKGVRDFKLSVTFHTPDGKVQILRKQFATL